ncbi:nuclear transport factor 2 family protein [Paraburkholderia rhynchosiae]|uniref:SnoaL-like domain-containing protein n=1 Tax=Paraburkholderia rhynchosiae TaxID=487049 RepID=A0A2N7W547_9BURK|nr:nuclear transport factor 2 family protein [Paraburkholderia rhynchosiae]PMS24515.1 hypothetical protein C0Z16_30850 [Paraburkholderia rhynchosiae]CAB3735786.1 hypothetical protein LMG27174_06239 [Paraburkholderia rhynchosiae]
MNVEDRLEIQELNHRYAYFVDCFEIDEWVRVFAPNAIFDEREFGNDLFVGHDAIRRYGHDIVAVTQHAVHLMSNHIIWSHDFDTARGTVFGLVEALSKRGERTRYQVRYEDEYVKIAGSWKIGKRILRKTFPPETVNAQLPAEGSSR